ncbi:MAG: antibiotic biosynthesis monooxygenase family protein [Nitrososphaerales archaeon]
MSEPRFARRLATRVKPDRVDDFISEVRDKISPKLKQQNGIRRIYLLRSTDSSNEFISLTLWDSKEAAEEYEKSGPYKEIVESIKDLVESEPSITNFDVEFHDVNAEDLPPPETAIEEVKKDITKSRPKAGKAKSKKKKGSGSRKRSR